MPIEAVCVLTYCLGLLIRISLRPPSYHPLLADHLTPSSPPLPSPHLPSPILFYPILSYPILSYSTLSSPPLPYSPLPYPPFPSAATNLLNNDFGFRSSDAGASYSPTLPASITRIFDAPITVSRRCAIVSTVQPLPAPNSRAIVFCMRASVS